MPHSFNVACHKYSNIFFSGNLLANEMIGLKFEKLRILQKHKGEINKS